MSEILMPETPKTRVMQLKRKLLEVLSENDASGVDGCNALASALYDGVTTLRQDVRHASSVADAARQISHGLRRLADATPETVKAVRQTLTSETLLN
jgi:hypothetical protein